MTRLSLYEVQARKQHYPRAPKIPEDGIFGGLVSEEMDAKLQSVVRQIERRLDGCVASGLVDDTARALVSQKAFIPFVLHAAQVTVNPGSTELRNLTMYLYGEYRRLTDIYAGAPFINQPTGDAK